MDQIHLYLVKCSRRIWKLIPDSGSRKGVEAAEKYLSGEISWEEAKKADWYSEGSAFLFDYSDETDAEVQKHTNAVIKHISEYEKLLVPPQKIKSESVQSLLKSAAYFANMALCYPGISFGFNHKETMEKYGMFMPINLFLETVSRDLYENVL